MAKARPRRIASDDCIVTMDGEAFTPHEGEWVEMHRGLTIGGLQAIAGMQRIGVDLQAIQGEEDAAAQALAQLGPHFERLCAYLAPRIVDWNWTDDAGRPLPKPDGTTAPLLLLNAQEINWLLAAAMGETPAERKNAWPPSATT